MPLVTYLGNDPRNNNNSVS